MSPYGPNFFVSSETPLINLTKLTIERQIGSQQKEFLNLGVTDSVLLLLSNNPSLVLITADLGFYLAATERGLNVVNFNHHREANSS